MLIRPGEGDEITLTFRDGTEMINVDYGDATGAGNPLVIQLEDVRDVAPLQIDVFRV